MAFRTQSLEYGRGNYYDQDIEQSVILAYYRLGEIL